jgi:hypothetical protein
MPRTISIDNARRMLRSRPVLIESGMSERDIAHALARGALVRIRRGWYVDAEDWRGLWNEGRHLLAVLAAHNDSSYAAPPFCFESAAVIHGLPLYRMTSSVVHSLIGATSHSRTKTGVARHSLHVDSGDVTEVSGLRCTTMDRTILDVAQRMPLEAAVASADAALRRVAVRDHRQQEEVAEDWRRGLLDRAARISTRGIRQARRVIAFADGRAQLPGESVSRLYLHRLGFRGIGLQTHVLGPDGEDYWTDFAFPEARVFGEFDGVGKYLAEELRGGRTIEQVVLAEKRREDAIRGVTGWRFVRWEAQHLLTAETLGARLASFGLRP